MRARPLYPAPPPLREELEQRLVPAIGHHHDRLDRLARLCAPIADEPPPARAGLLGWLTSAPAPTPEQRMRAAWRRVVLLRDRSDRATVERDALRGEVEALHAWRDVYVRCATLAEADPASLRAYEGAASVIDGVIRAVAAAGPLLDRMIVAFAALEQDQQAQAVVAERDLESGTRPSVSEDVRALSLDDVVVRLRACAVDQSELERTLTDRLPLAPGGSAPAWEAATDELIDAEDPVRAWRDRRFP